MWAACGCNDSEQFIHQHYQDDVKVVCSCGEHGPVLTTRNEWGETTSITGTSNDWPKREWSDETTTPHNV